MFVIVFKFEDIKNETKRETVKKVLREFCKTGKIIRETGYEKTMMSKIEKILCGDVEVLNDLLKAIEPFTDESLDGTFVALAAPSLEGKTQSAFVFEDILPLYFALQATENAKKPQEIYLNYASLNAALEHFAKRDLETLTGKYYGLNDDDLKEISKSNLGSSGKKSFVLGFLCRLIDDARNNFLAKTGDNRDPWMKYHAERSGKDFSFEAQPIAECKAENAQFDGFCLFLDEFVNEPWSVLIRNLARAVGLRCIVANTNGKIANLTGKNSVNFTGVSTTARQSIWSIVITSLGFISWEILKKKYPTLQVKLLELIKTVGDQYIDDKKLLKEFLQGGTLECLRPGLADFFASTIVNFSFSGDHSLTFAKFLSQITQILAEIMGKRKPDSIGSNYGHAASLGLLFSHAYEAKINPDYFSSMFNDSCFIEKHFYYLINPKDPEKFIFITFASSSDRDNYSLCLTEDGKLNWIAEATAFRSTEFMTVLSSFNLLPTDKSFYNVFLTARMESNNKKNDPGNYPNALAVKSDGNRLETFATASLIDASHHAMGNLLNTFEGQDGIIFVNNFIENLIFANRNRKVRDFCTQIKDEYQNDFNLKEFMANLKIPFLYSENCKIPEKLKKISAQNVDQLGKRSILIGEYSRPADREEIDGIFKCYKKVNILVPGRSLKRSKIEIFEKRSCIMECKNWKDSVPLSRIQKIIRKALGLEEKQKKELVQDAVLNFIICNDILDAKNLTITNFNSFCKKNLVNVFKIEKSNDAIQIVEMIEKLSSSPRLVCIIIELKTLNSISD